MWRLFRVKTRLMQLYVLMLSQLIGDRPWGAPIQWAEVTKRMAARSLRSPAHSAGPTSRKNSRLWGRWRVWIYQDGGQHRGLRMAYPNNEDRCALRTAMVVRGRWVRLAGRPSPIVRKNTPINGVALLRDQGTGPLVAVTRMRNLGLQDEA